MPSHPPAPSPGPLYLVGLGLCDENDLPLRSLELLRGCSSVFSESYTNLMREGTLARLERLIGRQIIHLGREEVEGERALLDACRAGPTALLVPGDPMSATTHDALRQSARERSIPVHVLHAASIFSAAPGAAGLQNYKFGKTLTLTYWRKNFEPTSFLDVLSENRARGAHTLCLLDIDVEMGPMKPSQALEVIERAQAKRRAPAADAPPSEGDALSDGAAGAPRAARPLSPAPLSFPTPSSVLTADTPLLVLWHVGWPDQRAWAGTRSEYPFPPGSPSAADEPPGPAVLIVPGAMHFGERESWERLRAGAKP